jgi:hypothetical protein
MDVTHVQTPGFSVRAIKNEAFFKRRQFGRRDIQQGARGEWGECIFMAHIAAMHRDPQRHQCDQSKKAFVGCSGLTTVTLGDGLEEIGEGACSRCKSLERIVTPNAVKAIKRCEFNHCSQLTAITLDDGLEEIGAWAFASCTSLHEIVIPSQRRQGDRVQGIPVLLKFDLRTMDWRR